MLSPSWHARPAGEDWRGGQEGSGGVCVCMCGWADGGSKACKVLVGQAPPDPLHNEVRGFPGRPLGPGRRRRWAPLGGRRRGGRGGGRWGRHPVADNGARMIIIIIMMMIVIVIYTAHYLPRHNRQYNGSDTTTAAKYLLPATYYLLPSTFHLYLLRSAIHILPHTFYIVPLPSSSYFLTFTLCSLPFQLLPSNFYTISSTFHLLSFTFLSAALLECLCVCLFVSGACAYSSVVFIID